MTKEDQIFSEGDIVPYINSASKICWTKVKSFKDVEHGRNRIWFYGNDVKTGAETYYPVNYSKNYIDAMEQYANQKALEIAAEAWDAAREWLVYNQLKNLKNAMAEEYASPDKQTFLSNLKKKI